MTEKAYRHPETGRLYLGRQFTANDLQYPANWLECATDADLAAHRITVHDDPTMTADDIAQEETYIEKQRHDAEVRQGQYAALGRFVQSFELMVDSARQAIYWMLQANGAHNDDLQILLNHRSLTARPLLEICESMLTRRFSEYQSAAAPDCDMARKILKQISREWRDLDEKRNSIVHATWQIGWGDVDSGVEAKVLATKITHSASEARGFKPVCLPETIAELDRLSGRCDANGKLLMRLWTCSVWSGAPRILRNFRLAADGKWEGTA